LVTRDVTSHVHLRVMEHIKTLAEVVDDVQICRQEIRWLARIPVFPQLFDAG